MWLLRKLNDGTTKYLISQKKSYTVGRKNCDITLEDDASISRKHCTFYVAKGEGSLTRNAPTRLWVLDENSKYGTFLKDNSNWVQLTANERKSLTNGSIIKFGILESIWRLEYKPVIACVSGISAEQKKKIETVLQSIDSCLRNSWCKECTLVIANDTTLTEKVVLALINGVPLVIPAYTEKVAECVNKQIELPSYKNYQPDIKESILDKSLVSLDTENHRRDLFKGKKFMIPTRKQLETFEKIIECAGGTVELLSTTHAWERLADDNVVVIQLPLNNSEISEQLIKSFKEITLFLKTNYGKRIVPESEIALAVAYSSTEKFCNPKSTCFNLKIGERKQIDLGPVIVEDTPISTEVKLSQPGMVCASATYDSDTPLLGNMGLQPSANKSIEFQHALARDLPVEGQHSGSTSEQEFQAHFPQRKRTLNSDSHDQETLSKRPRNPDTSSNECSGTQKESSAENKGSRDDLGETAGKGNPNSTAEAKSSCRTNYFHTKNALPLENIRVLNSTHSKRKMLPKRSKNSWSGSVDPCKGMPSNSWNLSEWKTIREPISFGQSVSDFWDCTTTHKRKISTESHDSGEDSSRKKAKLLERLNSRERSPEIHTSKEDDEIAHQSVSYGTANSVPSGQKVKDVEENNFTGYFGKETPDTGVDLSDLNNTILSLAIISPSFLKEDGSLADPPDVPVNVKRFKKQKVFPAPAVNPLEDEALSDGEWLEPHSDRLNISMPGEAEY